MIPNHNQENNNINPDEAPLFLVLEVTKKTMKLVYVDTPEMLSEKIFREHSLKVKIMNVADSADDRFQFVGCRISGRDIDLFRECIEELERKLILTGYRNYDGTIGSATGEIRSPHGSRTIYQ